METSSEKNMEKAILEAAETLFLEKGFDATSTTQIAKAVGCNQALIHYYFRTKENLFDTIFESKFKEFFQNIFDGFQVENLSFMDKITHFSLSHFNLLMANPRMPQLVLGELARKPESINTIREKLHVLPEQMAATLNAELQQEIAAGRVRNVTLMDIITTIISLNVALFTMMPIASKALQLNDMNIQFMLNHRKDENIKVILGYLRP